MDDFFMLTLRIAKGTFKILWKVFKPVLFWTGLLYPGALFLFAEIIEWQPGIGWWIGAWFLMIYAFFFLRSIIAMPIALIAVRAAHRARFAPSAGYKS